MSVPLGSMARLTFLVILLISGASSAQTAVVLWLESQGVVKPSVEPMTEQIGSTRLILESTVMLRYFHLHACKIVEIKGGSVEVGPPGFQVSEGGKVMA